MMRVLLVVKKICFFIKNFQVITTNRACLLNDTLNGDNALFGGKI